MADQPTLDIYLKITSVQPTSYSLSVTLKPSDDSIIIKETKEAICDHILACLKESYFGYDQFQEGFDETLSKNIRILKQKDNDGLIYIKYNTASLDNHLSLDVRTKSFIPSTKTLEAFLTLKEIQCGLAEMIKDERQEDKRVPFTNYTISYGDPIDNTEFTYEETDTNLPQVRLTDAIKIQEQRPITAVALETPEIEPQEAIPQEQTATYLGPIKVSEEEKDLTKNNGHKKHPTAAELEPLKDLAADDGKKKENDTSSLMPL